MRRGDIYPLDRVEKALSNFFRPGNLIALRELALQEVAQEVDRSLETYLDKEGGERNLGVRERFAVAISSNPAAQQIIGRAARMAKRLDAELYVVYVDIGTDESEAHQRSLASNIRYAEGVGAQVEHLKASTVAKAVADSVAEGIIPQEEADDLFVCVGVFIHWQAEDNKKIQDYNYKAVKESIARAVAGSPKASEVVAQRKNVKHPFAA